MATSLARFPGDVKLVNSRPTPGMFLSVGDAMAENSQLDLAVMCVPAAITAQALRESAAAGIRAALVCSGGFAEAGGIGVDYARAVNDVVAETGIRVLGPNTSGFFVPDSALFASFVPGVRSLGSGSVAVVAASGGINHVLSFQLEQEGAGVSVGVGIGAGIDVTAAEVLRYLIGHAQTRAVILHVETVPDGRDLVDAVHQLSAVVPVVALVVGRSDVSEFAQSHTGALATSWRATRAALRQAGAVLVDDEAEAVAAATALSGPRIPASANPGIALVTGQAGPGLVIADSLTSRAEFMPRLTEATQGTIGTLLPPMTFQANPVDTGRPGETFPAILLATAGDPGIDVLGVYAITEPVVDLVGAIERAGLRSGGVVLAVDGPSDEVDQVRRTARAAGIPLLHGPTPLAQGLAAIAADARSRAREHTDAVVVSQVGGLAGPWDEIRGKELLDRIGIRSPQRRRSRSRGEAHAALVELGGPVAVKLVDAEVLHKTDIGGVVLGVRTAGDLDDALDALEKAGAREFLLEQMAPVGVDLVVGAHVDPVFGPLVLLGIGGIAAEALDDVSLRLAPLSIEEADSMLDDLVTSKLVLGFRGAPSVDRRELAQAIASIAGLVASGEFVEVEVNPLRSTGGGLLALDAVVRIIPTQQEEGAQ
jgi:acetyltransferase